MKTSIVESAWLAEQGTRLGAQFHCSEGQGALHNLATSGLEMNPLREVCREIFIPPRFKRPYVEGSAWGTRYITGSSMLLARPHDSETYLSDRLTPNRAQLLLQKGTILVTCSGIIGHSVFVNDDLAGCIGSPDLLRLVPDNRAIKGGFLYAYLSSSLGRSLLVRQTYGSVVDHIEAHHTYSVPVPRFGHELEASIHDKITKAWEARQQANRLLDQARVTLSEISNLPAVEAAGSYESAEIKTYRLQSDELSLRLDEGRTSHDWLRSGYERA